MERTLSIDQRWPSSPRGSFAHLNTAEYRVDRLTYVEPSRQRHIVAPAKACRVSGVANASPCGTRSSLDKPENKPRKLCQFLVRKSCQFAFCSRLLIPLRATLDAKKTAER